MKQINIGDLVKLKIEYSKRLCVFFEYTEMQGFVMMYKEVKSLVHLGSPDPNKANPELFSVALLTMENRVMLVAYTLSEAC